MEPVEFREIAMILAVGEELSFTRAEIGRASCRERV